MRPTASAHGTHTDPRSSSVGSCNSLRSPAGLTLLETIVAIAIVAIILSTLMTVTSNSLRESRSGNFKTQATQLLDTVGRRIAGGSDATVLPNAGETIELDSNDLSEMANIELNDAADFEATIENLGEFTVSSTRLEQYRVVICYAGSAGERCVSGGTLGR